VELDSKPLLSSGSNLLGFRVAQQITLSLIMCPSVVFASQKNAPLA
jgi:hypothetical protein